MLSLSPNSPRLSKFNILDLENASSNLNPSLFNPKQKRATINARWWMEWALSNDSREIKRASKPATWMPVLPIIYYYLLLVGSWRDNWTTRKRRPRGAYASVPPTLPFNPTAGSSLFEITSPFTGRTVSFSIHRSHLLDNPIEETESSIMIFTISHRSNACVQRLVIGRTFSFLLLPSANRQIPRCNLLGFCCGVALRKRARTRKSRVIFCEISHDRGSNVNRSLEDRRTDDSFKNTRGFSFFHEGGACWRVPESRRLITQRQIHYSW